MNLAGRLARLEKERAKASPGGCALCGAGGEIVFSATFAEPGETPEPRPGCPRCGNGGVFVLTFDDAPDRGRSEVEA